MRHPPGQPSPASWPSDIQAPGPGYRDIVILRRYRRYTLEAAMSESDAQPLGSDPEPAGQPAPDPAAQPGSSSPPGPGGPGGPGGSSRDAIRLLVKAVGMLPDAERDEVYTWLLSRGLTSTYGTSHLPARLRDVSSQILSLQAAGGQPGPQQVVPVRFAAEQHAQLRAWCTEHGFSMATVVRGLVARFLEGQLPARN